VIFTYSFPLGVDAETAAMNLSHALASFARDISVPFDVEATPGDAFDNLPINLRKFCERISDGGGELWLLLDELQGPGLNSTPSVAARFTHTFKAVSLFCYPAPHAAAVLRLRSSHSLAPRAGFHSLLAASLPCPPRFPLLCLQVVEKCSPLARIAVTGSGLVALLNSFRTARVNGFALWDAVTYVGLGSAPSLPASTAMAARLLAQYAVAWPQAVRDAVAPQVLVNALVPSAHGGLTSARPALMAYALGCMGSASTGTAAVVLGNAQATVVHKLKEESLRDTLSALVSMSHVERRAVRDVATGLYTCDELMAIQMGQGAVHFTEKGHAFDEGLVVSELSPKLAALIGCLREKSLSEEGSSVVRLQPPYAVLLEGWVRRNGALAVSVDADTVHLDAATHSNLVLIAEERAAVASAGLWAKAATAFWTSLLINGIGFRDVSVTASGKIKIDLRAPASPEEFDKVPALARLNDMLSA